MQLRAISPTHLQYQEERHNGRIGQVLLDTRLKAKVMKETGSGKSISGQKESLLLIMNSRSGADLGAREDWTATLGGLGQALSHVKASALSSP